MSKRNAGDALNGVLLLDKAPGMTSNGALQRAKRLLDANKAGHTGSLDPAATGLLPICLGEATKFSGYLLDSHKRYRVRVRLGSVTSTADGEGEILRTRPIPEFNDADLENLLAGFRGEISQVPPMYSALKHQGRKLYELAREGVEVERQARCVQIYELQMRARGSDFLELDVHCSKGTYIRTLAEDLGEALGCGAHVDELRRISAGRFRLEDAIDLEQLEALPMESRRSLLLPMDCLAEDFPSVQLQDDATFFLLRGQSIFMPGLSLRGWTRMYDAQAGFLGMGEVTDEQKLAPRRLVQRQAQARESVEGQPSSVRTGLACS